jgi:hypothetical protein
VLREDRTKRSVLNAPLFDKMVYELQGEKMLRFNSLDLDGKMAAFTLKVSTKTHAQGHAAGTVVQPATGQA